MHLNRAGCYLGLLLLTLLVGCATTPRVAQRLPRKGDEIVVAGQLFHTGAPVVTWMDPGGFDAYRTERRFVPWEKASFEATTRETRDIDTPARYNVRFTPYRRPTSRGVGQTGNMLTPEQLE